MIYILLEKVLKTDYTRVEGVYATRELAEECMELLMDLYLEKRSYKIEEKFLQE